MTVDKVENATTTQSAVHYKVTMRVWSSDLDEATFSAELEAAVRKAIAGISTYERG